VKYIAVDECIAASGMIRGRTLDRQFRHALTLGVGLGSVIKKRRKKMRKHKHKKMLKKTRWQRRAHA
jgi:16S rRNA U1498 N3-methylase RsmE